MDILNEEDICVKCVSEHNSQDHHCSGTYVNKFGDIVHTNCRCRAQQNGKNINKIICLQCRGDRNQVSNQQQCEPKSPGQANHIHSNTPPEQNNHNNFGQVVTGNHSEWKGANIIPSEGFTGLYPDGYANGDYDLHAYDNPISHNQFHVWNSINVGSLSPAPAYLPEIASQKIRKNKRKIKRKSYLKEVKVCNTPPEQNNHNNFGQVVTANHSEWKEANIIPGVGFTGLYRVGYANGEYDLHAYDNPISHKQFHVWNSINVGSLSPAPAYLPEINSQKVRKNKRKIKKNHIYKK